LLRIGDTRWTFAQARDIAAGMAARLTQAGLKPGDRVALLCGNHPGILQVYLGCAWGGFVAVPPVDTSSTPAAARALAASIRPVLSETEIRARLMGARSAGLGKSGAAGMTLS
jgi:crotonobetaine/carnitine-CoA ligase